jgi:hypothetical protein
MRSKSSSKGEPITPYKVDYHVIQVIYFDDNRVFSGPEMVRLWSSMSVFGTRKVVGAFWRREQGTYNFQIGKEARFSLGSLEFLNPMLNGEEPVYGGGTYSRKQVSRDTIQDCDFYFTHGDPSRWDGIDTRPEFTLAVSGQWLENLGVERYLDKLKEHFALADSHSPPYGLVDIATPDDAWAGMVYGALWMQQSPLHRWVEQSNWVYAASKQADRARNIYWGNYFGPHILSRLGGRDNFIGRYREHARLKDGSPNAQIWEFTNGVFVSLCLDPLGCKPGKPLDYSAMFNLQWLIRELGSHGVLTAWESALVSSTDVAWPPSEHVESPTPSVEMLNKAEEQWIRECVDQATALAKKQLSLEEITTLDPVTLDRAYSGWLREWESAKPSEDPNTVVNCIGLAFGQWLVDCLGMKWSVVSDTSGTNLGVCIGPPESRIVTFPTHAVAKRLKTRETGFLQRLFETIRTQIDGLAQSVDGCRGA